MRLRSIIVIMIFGIILCSCSSEETSGSPSDSDVSTETVLSEVIDVSDVPNQPTDTSQNTINTEKDIFSEDFRVLNSDITEAGIVVINGSSEGISISTDSLEPWYDGSNGYIYYYIGQKIYLSDDPNDYVQADEDVVCSVARSLCLVSEDELSDEFATILQDDSISSNLYPYIAEISCEYIDSAVGDPADVLVDSSLFPVSSFYMRNEYNGIPVGQISAFPMGQTVFGANADVRYRCYPIVERGFTSLFDGINTFLYIDKYDYEIVDVTATVDVIPVTELEEEILIAMENERSLRRGVDLGRISAFAAELCYIPCYPTDGYSLDPTDDNGMLIPTWVVYCTSSEAGMITLFIDPADGSDLIKDGI